jgi:hypothetical protein
MNNKLKILCIEFETLIPVHLILINNLGYLGPRNCGETVFYALSSKEICKLFFSSVEIIL